MSGEPLDPICCFKANDDEIIVITLYPNIYINILCSGEIKITTQEFVRHVALDCI